MTKPRGALKGVNGRMVQPVTYSLSSSNRKPRSFSRYHYDNVAASHHAAVLGRCVVSGDEHNVAVQGFVNAHRVRSTFISGHFGADRWSTPVWSVASVF